MTTVQKAVKLAINPELKASGRSVAEALFNALLPQREEITSRNFRILLIDRVNPTDYNHAKTKAVNSGLTPDFARSAGEAIGKKVELDEKVEAKIHALLDKAEAEAHVAAQNADLAKRQEKADALQAKADAKAAREKTRLEAKAKKEEEAKAAKELKAKERADARALKAKTKEDEKAAKAKKIADDKTAAKKVADEQPEMKWQLVNKSTNEVVEYAPDRKIGLENKKKRDDAADIKVVKIPAVTA